MKNMIRTLVLVPAVVFASAAFAAEVSTVNVPFSFTDHGNTYPAGKYRVAVDLVTHTAKITGPTSASKPVLAVLMPGSGSPNAAANVSLEFSATGSTHQLRKIKYGAFSTSSSGASDSSTTLEAVQASHSSKASNGR